MTKYLYLLRSKKIKNFIYISIHYIIRIFYIFFFVFRIKEGTILVSNSGNKGWGDNPKYLIQKLKEKYPNTTVYWLVSPKANKKIIEELSSKKIIPIKYPSLFALYVFSISKVWVSNARLPLFLIKKKNQIYFQLWHGGCGPKKIEGQAKDKLLFSYILRAKNDSKMMNYAVSNSDFNSKIFQESFWYDGPILEYGSPRHDVFFWKDIKNNLKEKICKRYNLNCKSQLILYAPTFRSNKDVKIYKWNYSEIINTLNNKFGYQSTFLFRLHPNISYLAKEMNLTNEIIDVTEYEDMQELIAISDVVITDYSGVMMQAALAKKIVLLYIPDLEDYIDDRGFNIDITKLPFIIGKSLNELKNKVNEIESLDMYIDKQNAYLEQFNFYDDGNASLKTAEKIISIIKESTKDEKI